MKVVYLVTDFETDEVTVYSSLKLAEAVFNSLKRGMLSAKTVVSEG